MTGVALIEAISQCWEMSGNTVETFMETKAHTRHPAALIIQDSDNF